MNSSWVEVELAFFLLIVGGLLEDGLLVTEVTFSRSLVEAGGASGRLGGFRVLHPDRGWLGRSDSGTELRMSES